MQRPPDVLKNFSTTLAEMMSAAECRAEVQRVYEEYLASSQNQTHTEPPPTRGNNGKGVNGKGVIPGKPDLERIGIWEPIWEDGEVWFVRPDHADPLRMWGDLERIPPKKEKARVILLGESVARGALLDPFLNVAKALQAVLEYSGNDDIEVVDLARSALTFRGLEQMFEPSLALKPDVYIVFAGNNWHIPRPEMLSFERAVAIWRKTESWTSIKNYIEETVRNEVRAFVERLGAFSARNRVPIIFIIPDFNLQDWKLDFNWENPFATRDQIRQRLKLISEAEDALAEDNLEEAAVLARELIELEEGAHPAGFELLAKCELKQANFSEARRLRNNAKDIALIYLNLHVPACYAVIQEVLRKEGPANGIVMIDLPERIAEYLPQQLPDRRLFLDYAHMTAEGMRLAAASAIEKLLSLLEKKEWSWQALNQCELSVEPRGMALAHFGAACINNAWGQGEEVSSFHCAEAVRHDPRIAEVMQVFMNWLIRRNHLKYVKKFENAVGLKASRCLKFIRYFGDIHDKTLNLSLIQSMTAALSDYIPGIKEEFNLLVKEEHAITSEGIDVLHGCYADTELMYLPLEQQWRREKGYFRSYHQESFFRVVSDICALRVVLTYRLVKPDATERSIQLLVNGSVAANLVASTHWQTWRGTIAEELFHRGLNSIVVRWPEQPPQTRTERGEEVVQNLESVLLWADLDDLKDVYNVYGEIHEFKVASAVS